MKKLTSVTLGLLGILASATAYAVTWSGTVSLTNVEVDSSTVTYLQFGSLPSGKPTTCSGGATPNATFAIINLASSTDTQKALTTLATAALMGGRGVQVRWTGSCTQVGSTWYASIDALSLF